MAEYGSTIETGDRRSTLSALLRRFNVATLGFLCAFLREWQATPALLYAFTSGANGAVPYGGITLGKAGALYGTTAYGGGSPNCSAGCGTLYKLTPSSSGKWKEIVLHAFASAQDGAIPLGDVITDGRGSTLYSTTEVGGGSPNCSAGCGTVFGQKI